MLQGMNEPFNNDWNSDKKFSDLFFSLRWPLSRLYDERASVSPSTGLPLASGAIGFKVLRGYGSTLQVSYDVSPASMILNGKDIGSRGFLAVNGESENFTFSLNGIPSKVSLLTNLSGKVLTPEFRSAMQVFDGPIRVMNSLRTNNSRVKNFEDFTPLTASQTNEQENKGISLELIVATANELNRPLWFNIPHLATDECIARLATFFKVNLKVPLILEYSNEIWNAAKFSQGGDIFNILVPKARLDVSGPSRNLSTQGWDAVWQFQALRTMQIKGLFDNVGCPCRVILCGQAVSVDNTRLGLKFLKDNGLAMPDLLGYANYIGSGLAPGLATDLKNLFGMLNIRIDSENARFYDNWKFVADAFGIKNLALYEWGQHLVGVDPLFDAAQDDPRMGDIYKRLLDQSKDCEFGCHFYTFEKWNSPNSYRWGLSQGLAEKSVKRSVVESYAKGIVDPSSPPPPVIPPVIPPQPQPTVPGGLKDDEIVAFNFSLNPPRLTAVMKSGKIQRIL